LQQHKCTDAEHVLRQSLVLLEKREPDGWTTFNTKSTLGGSLLGQKQYKAATPLLLDGYEGMKQREAKIPDKDKLRIIEALERLVQVHDALGNKHKAAEWRQRLEAQKKPPSRIKGP